MATEKDAATTEKVQPDTGDSSAQTIEEVLAKNESLEARLKTAEGRVQGQTAQFENLVGHLSEGEARTEASIKLVLESVEVSPEKRAELEEHFTKVGAQRAASQRVTLVKPKLDKVVADAGKEWDTDPDLADARTAWSNGQADDALRLAEQAVRIDDGRFSKEQVEEIVDTRLKNKSDADNRVDMGGGTGGGGGGSEETPTTVEGVHALLRANIASNTRMSKDETAALLRGIKPS